MKSILWIPAGLAAALGAGVIAMLIAGRGRQATAADLDSN